MRGDQTIRPGGAFGGISAEPAGAPGDVVAAARARLRRRTEIAMEAARLVRTRGLEAARFIGRTQFREAEFPLFERLAERCDRRLRG
ncbi:hypothetical protein [Amaricoccus solimangrovi]|uniref:Uncharacterized protein n=1 Tax=Amaricoccus solimangrovi TaxID=2589815 RepID=A0A501WWD1_9RHOB|nr:hypothetical protein [Amaricoccus solimangrovi]TPE53042.1 hypothetical protein FJM51_03175 [Amaricoccus solimangrovi]